MLSRRDIEKELGKGINIVPIIRDNFKENSINLTASQNAWTMGSGTVYWFGGTKFSVHEPTGKKRAKTFSKGSNCVFWDRQGDQHNSYIVLLPHSTTLIETSEVLGVANNIGGALHSKVGLVSKGIGHIGTMLGPGYCGHLLIALHNITDEAIAIKVGSTFVSLSFDYLTTQVMRTSSTVSGHLDKFPELGININEETRSYLTADWKSNIEGIREKMCESEAYKDYKKHIRENSWKELKKYISKRNVVAVFVIAVVIIGIYFGAVMLDKKLESPIWVDRFWNVGFSGIIGSLIIALWNFIKDKK